MQRCASAPLSSPCRMTSSCLVGSWRWSRPTWRMSCGFSTSLHAAGRCGNRLRLLPTPWRGTPPMWWHWPTATPPCWPSLATRPFTATSTKFRSTTSVSWPADTAVSVCVCLIAFYWQQSNTGDSVIDPRTLIFTHVFNAHLLRFHSYVFFFYWFLILCREWTTQSSPVVARLKLCFFQSNFCNVL